MLGTFRWPTGCSVALMLLTAFATWWAQAYYDQRFGHIKSGRGYDLLWLVGLLLVLWAGAALTRNPQTAMDCVLAVYFLINFGLSFGRRWHHLVLGALFTVVAAMPPLSGTRHIWLFGGSLILTGLLDHILLMRSLPGLRTVENHG